MKRVIVNGSYTYETLLELEAGDKVICPGSFLTDFRPWEATVTALTSDYAGPCKRIISKVEQTHALV
jgi:hypothetical protein